MFKKLILIIFSCFFIACSNADNYETKYVDRKAPKEKEELEMYVDRKAPREKEVEQAQKQEKYYSDTSVLEDVATQLVSDIIDLGLRVLIYSIIPH